MPLQQCSRRIRRREQPLYNLFFPKSLFYRFFSAPSIYHIAFFAKRIILSSLSNCLSKTAELFSTSNFNNRLSIQIPHFCNFKTIITAASNLPIRKNNKISKRIYTWRKNLIIFFLFIGRITSSRC